MRTPLNSWSLGAAAAAAMLTAAQAAPPPATPPRPSVITQPDWLAKPRGEDLSSAYPQFAWRLEIEGRAVISCRIDDVGRLQACRTLEETPKGIGFGDAAITMSKSFQMRPMTRDGQPVAGGVVTIPLRFVLPQPFPEDPPPAPTSPRALELARQLLLETDALGATRAGFETQITELEFISRPDVSDEARQALAKALRESFTSNLDQAREDFARLYAHALTAEQLEAVLAFSRTPAGKVMMRPDDEARAMETMIGRESHRLSVAAAREAFCATHDCGADPDVAGLMRDAAGPHPKVMIPSPTWDQTPGGDVIEMQRPELSKGPGLGGAVRLTCKVAPLGALKDCVVASERPAGVGFGKAAVNLSSWYRLSPDLLAKGAAGETVGVLVSFPQEPADTAAPFAGVPPRSDAAMALARRLTSPMDARRVAEAWSRRLAAHADQIPAGLSVGEVQALGQAEIAGAAAAQTRVADLQAAYLTQRLTDAQLQAAIAFSESAAGKAWKANAADAVVASDALNRAIAHRIAREAGRIFCKAQGCPGVTAAGQAKGASAEPSTRTP